MTETFGMIANEVEETQLTKQQTDTVSAANSIVVSDKVSYDFAMNFLKNVKSVAKSITEYWAEPKRKANESWKAICSKEKDMLSPLSDAEAIVKKKMQTFADEQRRLEMEIQRKQEEARRIEATRLMEEAANAEKNGDTFGAEVNMAMAATLESPENFVGNTVQSGSRQIADFIIVDEALVPNWINGVCIRPIDTSAIKKIYSLTGQVPPGIRVDKKTSIVVR